MRSGYGFALALVDAGVMNGRGAISAPVAEGCCAAPPRGVKRTIAACSR